MFAGEESIVFVTAQNFKHRRRAHIDVIHSTLAVFCFSSLRDDAILMKTYAVLYVRDIAIMLPVHHPLGLEAEQ